MMMLNSRHGIPVGHTSNPQDTVLPLLVAVSPTITRISQQVLPTSATLPPQSVLMAWQAAVICTEREELEFNVSVIVTRTGRRAVWRHYRRQQ